MKIWDRLRFGSFAGRMRERAMHEMARQRDEADIERVKRYESVMRDFVVTPAAERGPAPALPTPRGWRYMLRSPAGEVFGPVNVEAAEAADPSWQTWRIPG